MIEANHSTRVVARRGGDVKDSSLGAWARVSGAIVNRQRI